MVAFVKYNLCMCFQHRPVLCVAWCQQISKDMLVVNAAAASIYYFISVV